MLSYHQGQQQLPFLTKSSKSEQSNTVREGHSFKRGLIISGEISISPRCLSWCNSVFHLTSSVSSASQKNTI